MAVGDILQLIDRQSVAGLMEVMNVYYYQVAVDSLGGDNALPLAEAYVADVLPSILAIQTSGMQHYMIEVRNLDDPTDFTFLNLSPSEDGTNATEGLPPFAAWTFQYVRATMEVRHGWKRIAGIPESMQVNGVRASGAIAAVDAVAAAMGDNLDEDGGTGQYIPRIVRLIYEEGELISKTAFPISGVGYRHIGTQNSRKFGSGS